MIQTLARLDMLISFIKFSLKVKLINLTMRRVQSIKGSLKNSMIPKAKAVLSLNQSTKSINKGLVALIKC